MAFFRLMKGDPRVPINDRNLAVNVLQILLNVSLPCFQDKDPDRSYGVNNLMH